MKIEKTPLEGCFVLTPSIYEDARGHFKETFHKERFQKLTGASGDFVQDNESKSSRLALRGLHFQIGVHAQAKLVRVVQGAVLDVCVDLRENSPTFKQWYSVELNAKNHKQMYIPRGFAHAFLALEDDTVFSYKCDNYYNHEAERGIRFDDPELNIDWGYPNEDLILSDKDQAFPTLKEFLSDV